MLHDFPHYQLRNSLGPEHEKDEHDNSIVEEEDRLVGQDALGDGVIALGELGQQDCRCGQVAIVERCNCPVFGATQVLGDAADVRVSGEGQPRSDAVQQELSGIE